MLKVILKRLSVYSGTLIVASFIAILCFCFFTSTLNRHVDVDIHRTVGSTGTHSAADSTPVNPGVRPLNLMTLNIAHGRGDAFNQMFLSRREIKLNLGRLARFFSLHQPDVVALQEVDTNSFWNGYFNHVHYLANAAKYRYSTHGTHVEGFNIAYGTAILSKFKMSRAYSYSFAPTPPTLSKGFTFATIAWPFSHDDTGATVKSKIDVISIHLDFSRDSVRQRQTAELIEFIKKRRRPTIVMGDFNSDWSQSGIIPKLQTELGFKTHSLNKKGLVTFPSSRSRLDWIFVSPELEIVKHQIIATRLSDHYAVYAQVQLKDSEKVSVKYRVNDSSAPGPITPNPAE